MNKKTLNNLTYLYICIPIIIFLLGWCKLYISVPITLLIIFSFITRIEKYKQIDNLVKFTKNHKKEIVITIAIAIIYVFISGIGGYVYQNPDHIYRNSIFKELIDNKWPIYHTPQGVFDFDTIFVYYFALWLPAALIGKIFNLSLAYFALFIWCVLGVLLTFSYLKKYYKGKYYIPILLFIVFSGLDIIERFIYGNNFFEMLTSINHLEWIGSFQMSSFTTQLFWVYNQAIPAWLITMFILNEKDNRYIGVIMAMSLLFCTLPAIGLIFLFIYKIFFESLTKKNKVNIKNWAQKTFSWQNMFVGIPILLINYLFLKSNLSGNQINFGAATYQYLNILIIYVFEFGIYYFISYKYIDNKKLYWLSLISLLICPLVRIGHSQDFCMRACIPGQIVMFTFVLKTLYQTKKRNKNVFKILCIIILLGSVTALNEIKRTNVNTGYNTKIEYTDLLNCYDSPNFYGNKNNSSFVKYIAK